MDRAELEQKIIAKAWKDPAFKKKLLEKPKETIHRFVQEVYHNQDILPKDVKCQVLEDNGNMLTIVIPPTPENSGELSEADIAQVVGGKGSPNHSKSARNPRIIYHPSNQENFGAGGKGIIRSADVG